MLHTNAEHRAEGHPQRYSVELCQSFNTLFGRAEVQDVADMAGAVTTTGGSQAAGQHPPPHRAACAGRPIPVGAGR